MQPHIYTVSGCRWSVACTVALLCRSHFLPSTFRSQWAANEMRNILQIDPISQIKKGRIVRFFLMWPWIFLTHRDSTVEASSVKNKYKFWRIFTFFSGLHEALCCCTHGTLQYTSRTEMFDVNHMLVLHKYISVAWPPVCTCLCILKFSLISVV